MRQRRWRYGSKLLGWFAVMLCASGCVTARAECVVHGGTEWREVRTEHIVMSTNLDSQDARAAAVELEYARSALLLAFHVEAVPAGPLTAVVLRRHSQLEEFAPPSVLGFFDPRGQLVVVTAGEALIHPKPNLGVVLHELTHWYAASSFRRQPRWFAEGLARYLETMVVDSDRQEVSLGEPNFQDYEYSQLDVATLEELWSWNPEVVPVTKLYASSWLWMHFLMNRRSEALGTFELALARGKSPRAAWDQSFKGDSNLTREVQDYLLGGTYAVTKVGLQAVAQTVEERSLTPAEVHLIRARLAQASSVDPRPSRDVEVDVALGFDPSDVRARFMKVESTTDAQQRLALARALVMDLPNDPAAWRALASNLNEASEKAEATAAWERALALDPQDPATQAALVAVEHRAGNLERALTLATSASRARPWDAALLYELSELWLAKGHCDEALETYVRMVELVDEQADKKTRAQLFKRQERFAHCQRPP
jgi:tetratricopeptide (TPR) repeat protein